MAELDGPRLAPRTGPARQLVVFLHGYGADGNDLIEIGRAWQGLLPSAAFVSPHAPRPCGQAPVGREWFPLTFRDPDERWLGVNAAAPVLNSFLDAELQRHNLPVSALAAEIRNRPPVLLVHGDEDQLIPVQALFHAAQGLAALEVPVEWHISEGIGHGIDQEGLRQGGEFLAKRFARLK
jgi:phospholipase/carboxylesterase